MKKKSLKSFLAIVAAVVMMIQEPSAALAAEKAETQTEETEGESETEKTEASEEQTEKEVSEISESEISEIEASSEKTTEIPAQTETSEEKLTEESSAKDNPTEEATQTEGAQETTEQTEGVPPETTEQTEGVSETTETPEETTQDISETETEESGTETIATELSTDNIAAEYDALSVEAMGFKTMALDDAMLEEKSTLAEVVFSMKSMKADEDYNGHELVYYADSQEKAEQIAECYNGRITDFEYGIAVIEIEEDASKAIQLAADPAIGLPAVYPNIYYQLCEEQQLGDIEEIEAYREEKNNASETNGLILPYEDEHLYAAEPNDPGFKKQWYHNTVSTLASWDATKGEGVVVAVLDTGIDPEHPDLRDNLKEYTSTVTYEYESNPGYDLNSHGTHCAGIIAAKDNNGIGVAGIAPNASIISIKVLGTQGGTTADIVQGINLAVIKDVDAISMSLGGICWDQMYENAVNTAVNRGIVIVAAAGNESTSQKSYPAAYNNVIAVAATDSYNGLTYFSNYGSWVDIAAPGDQIYSTVPDSSYANKSGTSMACPVVSGTVALILANSSELRNTNSKACVDKVKNILLGSAVYNEAWSKNDAKYYPLLDTEASVYAVENSAVNMPKISFSSPPDDKNVVLAGENQYFELTTTTPHAKIYYTLNGKKPTAKTGMLYRGRNYMTVSGKVKIQAVTVVGSKTSSVFSATYTFDVKAESLSSTCAENMTVAIGKSIQLSVEISPKNASKKDFDWTSSDTTGMIKVDKKGKVTCNKNTPRDAMAVITAATKDGTNLSYQFTVKAVGEMAGSVTLNASSLKMSVWADSTVVNMKRDGYVSEFQLIPSSDVQTSQYIFKSSNTKVAEVDAFGNVYPVAKGKAKITVTANDGSGKKAVCDVTVVTPVFDIYGVTSTGFSGYYDGIPIATGCSVSIKTTINYGSKYSEDKASNTKLEWFSNNSSVTVSNGKVKCKSNAIPGTRVTITARAKDGFGTYAAYTFEVKDKIKKIYIRSGRKQLTSYSVKLKVGQSISDPFRNVICTSQHNSANICKIISPTVSKKDVAYRYYNNNYGNMIIVGTKPGSAKVTYTIMDGSNKKFTVNIKVTK